MTPSKSKINTTINYNKIVKRMSKLISEKKALDIKIIHVTKLTSLADYFIICSSDSGPQTKAIVNHIKDQIFNEYNIKPLHIEGYENLNWVLLDYINIVINIFNKKERKYYNIERLWADAKIITLKN